MSHNPVGSKFNLSFMSSIVGILSLVFLQFGGLYTYNYYAGYQAWYPISLFSSLESLIVLGSVLVCFVLSLNLANKGKNGKLANDEFPKAKKYATWSLTGVVLAGVIVAVVGSDYTDWWLDTGFYAALIAAIVNYNAIKGVEKTGYFAGNYSPQHNQRRPNQFQQPQRQTFGTVNQFQQPPRQKTGPVASFCGNCGAGVQNTKFCGSCGTEVN